MNNRKKVLMGLSVSQLKELVKQLGMPAFTGGQIAKWLYDKHVKSIDEMTNLSKANRERLAENYCVGAMDPMHSQRSVDGTVKYLFPVRCSEYADCSNSNGGEVNTTKFVETVFIPDGDRGTLCVSSQVGCKMNCLFCQTGKQGFEGSLTAADILNQIYSLPERELLTNIVFMGQGEPMDNLDSVLQVTNLLTAPDGYAWSPKRITVSSVGIKSKLKRFLDESECHVAISMHSPLHEQRLSLMPAEKAMPIAETVELLKQYDFTHQRRCSFEYICFGGLNDSLTHAKEIIKLVDGLECRVNLIRFHEIPHVDLPSANEARMEQLRDYLTQHGVFTTIRASRGQDIFAACGLLSTAQKSQQS
ncbi:23S rRNA (adenine(2503)-C(2))-methyltransferase RlmN [Prevotella sp. E13-17]|uniref:23S rRNA (adenine(2503)-C(2))-methyltransferase RlmN n=1 Tax=Prevotella sp. E13-17 TaxID=2913616 RepID=UPI001EDC6ECD|nr:23S rRNA (adenine(2503)-C(2))-methyltransferase RlmN [Prevotella sp. E13-17]UKK51825.1 23S rRNA (adenine(2503)-C(2))-methyltransferase RlmN [Prevotella sp. E13-17]